ncbi:MAG: DUF4419 domain-containing protein [Sulfobacillus sp.]
MGNYLPRAKQEIQSFRRERNDSPGEYLRVALNPELHPRAGEHFDQSWTGFGSPDPNPIYSRTFVQGAAVSPADKICGPLRNAFFAQWFAAYADHGSVFVDPDDVWQHLLLQIAEYLSASCDGLMGTRNGERYRSAFVGFSGKKKLKLIVGDLATESNWESMLVQFRDLVSAQLKDDSRGLLRDFSNSTDLDRAFNAAAAMGAFKEYFEYSCSVLCGIRYVFLGGTPEDWRDLRQRVGILRRIGLSTWSDSLEPVLDQFVSAREGRIDRQWWNRIFRTDAGEVTEQGMFYGYSGPQNEVTGWFRCFYRELHAKEKIPVDQFQGASSECQLVIDTRGTQMKLIVSAFHSGYQKSADGEYRLAKTILIKDGSSPEDHP